MKQAISKARTKKTRTREKRAVKTPAEKVPVHQTRLFGLFIGFLLWASVVAGHGIEHLVHGNLTAAALLPLAGDATFLLVSMFVACFMIHLTEPALLRRNSRIGLLCLTSLLSLVVGKGVLYLPQAAPVMRMEIVRFLLPFAMSPLLATMLTRRTIGSIVGFWTSLALAVMAGRSLPLFVTGMVASVVTAEVAHHLRRRSRVFRTGVIIGLSQVSCVFGLTAINWQSPDLALVFWQAGACLAGGLFSAFVVVLILPLFELTFGIASDITLLELSDLRHPLLQKLAVEAPGTYHHSLVVANLAQAAAELIGANSLLARVSAYFHDIGKLTKPDFFAENIHMRNPHDDLAPSMSTLVITSHVKEGLSLALLHKLPPAVMDTIREHHGTSVIAPFYHKARKEVDRGGDAANGRKSPDESDFRYGGPIPSSRESGIVCLADAVEAASRSMEKVTPTHIESLVNDIVNRRLLDGQLDACELTLREVRTIKRSFAFTLSSMMHGRIPYPKDDEDRNQQPAGAPSDGQAGDKKAAAAPDGEGRRT